MSRVFPHVIGQETSFLVPLKCRVSERVKMSIETTKFRSVTFRRGKHGLALINEQQSVQSWVCILTEIIVFCAENEKYHQHTSTWYEYR